MDPRLILCEGSVACDAWYIGCCITVAVPSQWMPQHHSGASQRQPVVVMTDNRPNSMTWRNLSEELFRILSLCAEDQSSVGWSVESLRWQASLFSLRESNVAPSDSAYHCTHHSTEFVPLRTTLCSNQRIFLFFYVFWILFIVVFWKYFLTSANTK